MFKIGDKVLYEGRPGKEAGTVTDLPQVSPHYYVEWADGENIWCLTDKLTLVKEDSTDTPRIIPTKGQVLDAAESCPQAAEALRTLFPHDFEEVFAWKDLLNNPFNYLRFDESKGMVYMTPALRAALASRKLPYDPDWDKPLHLGLLRKLLAVLWKAGVEALSK